MAVGGLLALAGCISSCDDAIATFRRTGQVFVIVSVAIYIALTNLHITQDALTVIVTRRDQKLAYGVTVMIHLRMAIQLFRPHFAMMPGRSQALASSGVVKARSINNRMYPILVCLRSLVFRRVL